MKGRILLLTALCAVALTLVGTQARGESLPAIARAKADSMERVQVVWNGRVCPVGTVARDFLLKVYGKTTYHGLTATQVMASWTLAPMEWNKTPIIKRKRGEYACLDDFIDYTSPTPRLKGMGTDAKVDERVALAVMLQEGTLVAALPEDAERLGEARVSAELLYHAVPWMVAGIVLALAVALLRVTKHGRAARWTTVPLVVLLALHLGLRWYVCGHVPVANTFETLMFVALCLAPFLPLGTAVVLVVAFLLERNPQITPLVPVLNSPWLSAHVTCVMLSYALLVASVWRRGLLRVAVPLLGVGIFLGAVWANVSWGSYWSWDPKEAWALITFIVYSLPLHDGELPWFRKERNYRIYSAGALACLVMTYLGVNYLMGGMHSYG